MAHMRDDAKSWLVDHHLGDLEPLLVDTGFLTLASILSITDEYVSTSSSLNWR
jgi:hypothetical protein